MNCGSYQILLVDDNEADRYMMAKAWKMAGVNADLQFATDGEEALSMLSEWPENDEDPIGMVLMDINMPIKGGLQTVEQIRQSDPSIRHIPVLLWSSSSRVEDVNQAYSFGANAYLLKPTGVKEYVAIAESIHSFWCSRVQLPAFESGA